MSCLTKISKVLVNCSGIFPIRKSVLLRYSPEPLQVSLIRRRFFVYQDQRGLAKLAGKTGVEMEALTAVSVACLTLFDMCKAADPAMEIHDIKVLTKAGGKSGDWQAA